MKRFGGTKPPEHPKLRLWQTTFERIASTAGGAKSPQRSCAVSKVAVRKLRQNDPFFKSRCANCIGKN